jgi:hypothetical protein
VTPELLSTLVAGLAALVTALGAVLGKRAAAVREERDNAEAALVAERKARRADARRIGRLERALDRAGIPDPDEQETRRANPDPAAPPRRRRRAPDSAGE